MTLPSRAAAFLAWEAAWTALETAPDTTSPAGYGALCAAEHRARLAYMTEVGMGEPGRVMPSGWLARVVGAG